MPLGNSFCDMTGKKYNVGIIGYGWVAGAHIAAINATALARVTAVWSSRKLDSAEVSARHGAEITCHSELSAMLADPEIHAVSICSYPQDHPRHSVMAAEAGKHLIIEKPLALNWEGCQEIQKAVQAGGSKPACALSAGSAANFAPSNR